VDAERFDDYLRALTRSNGSSRRGITRALGGITLGGSLGAWLSLADLEAKRKNKKRKRKRKKRKNKKKNPCTPKCAECQTCTDGACVNKPNGTACSDGACRFGACQACGADGQTCCEDDTCPDSGECGFDTCCRQDGSCGELFTPCCADGACDGTLHCVLDHGDPMCFPADTPCGAAGETCCVDETGYSCDGDLFCNLATGTCGETTDCGGENAGCCADGSTVTCDPGLACTTGHDCVPSCGAEDEPCCVIDSVTVECDGALVCALSGRSSRCVPVCGGEGQPCCVGGCDAGCDGSLVCERATCQEPEPG
jgi:hypothetical protein